MGLIHLDAGVLIGFFDGSDAHHTSARRVFAEASESGDDLAMAASAIAECLVAPARRGEDAILTLTGLLERLPIAVVDLDLDVAVAAARLRARHRALRLPDALVIATATVARAEVLVTTDHRWPARLGFGGKLRIL